jgi:hypothetical protein
MLPSSLCCPFCIPLLSVSGRLSDDCERFRAFCAEPRIPSLLKLAVLEDLSDVGDFSALGPFAEFSCGDGISMEKPSRLCRGYRTVGCEVAATPPAPEWVDSPVEEGDMFSVRMLRRAVVADVMGNFAPERDYPQTHAPDRLEGSCNDADRSDGTPESKRVDLWMLCAGDNLSDFLHE